MKMIFLKFFFWFFISFLTIAIVKNSHILAVIYFTFLKKCPRQNLETFKAKFGHQWKYRKNSYQVKQIWALFRN